MQAVPIWVGILFIGITLATIGAMYWATRSKALLAILLVWSAAQTAIGLSGFYYDTQSLPPRIMLGLLLPVLGIIGLLVTPKGRAFLRHADLARITALHTIRIPVEIVLMLLAHAGVISVWQTFEGSNFDILSGLSAPLVAYFGVRKGKMGLTAIKVWNVLCLLLLLNVVITSAVAMPTPLQQIAFDQPNIAITYFPFNLLPTVVVPLVMLAHAMALVRREK
jgi:hypothetical protein